MSMSEMPVKPIRGGADRLSNEERRKLYHERKATETPEQAELRRAAAREAMRWYRANNPGKDAAAQKQRNERISEERRERRADPEWQDGRRRTGEVVGTVKADGDGEQAIIGTDGLIYVNSENTADVVVYDPKSLEVKKRFPIGVAKTPTGLAYDAKTKRLFIGCRDEPKMVVMDAASGKVITSFPIGRGVDYAGFDPQAKLIFFSCGDGTLSIYHEKSADQYEDAGAVKTQPSAKTMAFDPKTKKIFLAAAEYVETPATPPATRPQRSIKPDSFVVMVVGK